jgi:hypothetical protein
MIPESFDFLNPKSKVLTALHDQACSSSTRPSVNTGLGDFERDKKRFVWKENDKIGTAVTI